MDKLKESDPEFYEFLKNEDQELLAFEGDEDDEDEENSDDDEEEEAGVKGRVHKPPTKLEVTI